MLMLCTILINIYFCGNFEDICFRDNLNFGFISFAKSK